MSDELDLGNLAITITDGEPAEAKFDLPNGTSITRTFPESGTINMRLGLGLSLSHQRPPAAEGGGGEPETIVSLDFQNANYTLNGAPSTLNALVEQDMAWGTWDPNSIIPGTGLVDSEGDGQRPSLTAAADTVVLAAGFTVILDMTFASSAVAYTIAFDLPTQAQEFKALLHAAPEQNTLFLGDVDIALPNIAVGAHKIAVTMTEELCYVVIDGGSATSLAPIAEWISNSVAFMFASGTVRSAKFYAPLTVEQAQGLTT